ncbi:Ig-like domain-containing protein [Haloarcula marismortui]|uniref:Ig-like domain-containing protein n=1 Tax=Haloarcula marismortui TaxID=2238 RepID=UPI001E2F6297|nr:Ig-like domain-containing protein [Haloarcula sinaiiensis]
MAGTATAEPVVTVSTASGEISEGETIKTTDEVTININAAADSMITVVEIRIDGDVVKTYEPKSSTFSKTTTPDTGDGEQNVEIIVSSDRVTTFNYTIVQDSIPPVIEYTSPVQRYSGRSSPSNVTVENAYVNLSGNISDTTGVNTVSIRQTYQHSSNASSGQSVRTYRINNPGNRFNQQLFLGSGENELLARYTDEMGNVRRHEFTISVSDSENPKISLTVPNRTFNQQVEMQVSVTDNVQLQTVTVERPDGTGFRPITESNPEPDPSLLSTKISRNISLDEGKNNISVTATDRDGNSASESATITYNRQIEPKITIYRNQTQITNGNLSLQAAVIQGEITRVSVETINLTTNDIVDLQLIYSGTVRERVDIGEIIALAGGRTQVQVSATDSEGELHTNVLVADNRSEKVFINESSLADERSAQTATEAQAVSNESSNDSNTSNTPGTDEAIQETITATTTGATTEPTKIPASTAIEATGVSVVVTKINQTQIQLGDTVTVNASIENRRRINQDVVVPVAANGEVIYTQNKTIPKNSTINMSLQYTANKPGNVSLQVGSAPAGKISVSEDSGLVPLDLVRNGLIVFGSIVIGGYLILKSLAIYLGY